MHYGDYPTKSLVRGFVRDNQTYRCLFCDSCYVRGEIYDLGGQLVEAKAAATLHVARVHKSPFEVLIAEGKKQTGLSEVQSALMTHFYHGTPDKQIAALTQTSPSTVRYQRFSLREKARQARVFLALLELMEQSGSYDDEIEVHRGATMVDERYMTDEKEKKKIIETFFSSIEPLVLKSFSSKEKKKLVILRTIAEQFDPTLRYSEIEISAILSAIYPDYATLRRYLIEYGFMARTVDGSAYWRVN